MSLSIVFGMPMTAICQAAPRGLVARSRARRAACRRRRSTNRMPTPSCSSRSTIAAGSCGPRDDPRIVPPCSWMWLTTSGVSSSGGVPVPSHEALEAEAEPVDRPDAVVMVEAQHDRADHVVEARTQPAAGDDAAASVDGSKKSCSRGPPHSIAGGSPPRLELTQLVQRRRIEHALVVAQRSGRRASATALRPSPSARDGEVGTAVGGHRRPGPPAVVVDAAPARPGVTFQMSRQ